jgi:flavin reductase (DIM6/NTAB) family NADH-FMN oxidoreductase RutF
VIVQREGALAPVTDPVSLRAAFASFPSGVTAVCGMHDGVPRGLAASSFTPVSLDPCLVSVCVAHTSTTWPLLSSLPALGVSVLAENHADVCRALSAKGADRFGGAEWDVSPAGAVLLRGSGLWLECTIERQLEAGDHMIVLLRVAALMTRPGTAPLVFHGSTFRRLAS